MNKYQHEINCNKNFSYVTTEFYTEKIKCPPGIKVTHCFTCVKTCHDNCVYETDQK